MGRVIGVAALVAVAVLLGSAFLFFGGCEKRPDLWQPPEDELSGEAAVVPPGKVKVRLTRKPDALPPDATEASYEWAVLASLQADRLDPELRPKPGETGWTVIRYRLVVKAVGEDDSATIPEGERVRPKVGMRFLRHEGELHWAAYYPRALKQSGTAGYHYHIPGKAKLVRVYPTSEWGLGRLKPAAGDPQLDPSPPQPAGVEIFKPWTYSVEVKAGPLADVVRPLLTSQVVLDLPAKVDVLQVGDAVTSLDLRP